MKKTLIFLSAIILLAACTTTQQADEALNLRFHGEDFDKFVLAYGPPVSQYKLKDKSTMYTWRSDINSYRMPTQTNITGMASPMGFNGYATTTGGGIVNVFCEVSIVTTPAGKIKSIRPTRDTIGNWTTSRCAEIFK